LTDFYWYDIRGGFTAKASVAGIAMRFELGWFSLQEKTEVHGW